MATIKSFTSVEQSRKLAEILPIESADMHYCLEQRDVATGYEIGITPFTKTKEFVGKCNIIDVQPAWSLAALIDVLPAYIIKDRLRLKMDKSNMDFSVWYESKDGLMDNSLYIVYSNSVDACVNMIIKLKEKNLL